MKITKEQLTQILKEEIAKVLEDKGPAAKSARRAARKKRAELRAAAAKTPIAIGRKHAEDGKDPDPSADYNEKQKAQYEAGYKQGMQILKDKAALRNETINEQ